MRDTLQENIGGYLKSNLDYQFKMTIDRLLDGFSNMDFYPYPEKQRSYLELCSGMETKEPKLRVDGSRLVLSMGLCKKMIRMDSYCDSDWTADQLDIRTVVAPDTKMSGMSEKELEI